MKQERSTSSYRTRVSRRDVLKAGGLSAVGIGLPCVTGASIDFDNGADQSALGVHDSVDTGTYYPPSEIEGGWRKAAPSDLGVSMAKLREAFRYHDSADVTTSYGGALVIIYKGHLIAESYTTGDLGGPENWTPATCNDMKSSTKSVFGTAAGVFLDEYRDTVDLETPLIGVSHDSSLIPQIWSQPLTDERKMLIKVKHVLSMTSGLETPEPWLAPGIHKHFPGYSGAHQMYEYCFGWWHFDGVTAQHTLKFQPGSDFNYSNYGLEQFALAIRNLSGEMVGPYLYDRVLRPIGMPGTIRDNRYRDMPYSDSKELNFANEEGWGVGGSEGCDAYGADKSASSMGVNTIAGSTFRCNARDFARLGYLWLHKGKWQDRQLVPAAWMQHATRRFVRDDGSAPRDYGYTFWIGDEIAGVPDDMFMSRGHNMNHSFVIPSLDLVVVRQGNDNRRESEGKPFSTTLIQKIIASVSG